MAKKAATKKARTRKSGADLGPDTESAVNSVNEALRDKFGLPELPPKIERGNPNPAYFRAALAEINGLERLTMFGEHEIPRGFDYKKMREGLLAEAETYGIDPKHIQDSRSESEKALDCIEKMADIPRSVLEALDAELDAIEGANKTAAELAYEYAGEKLRPKQVEAAGKVLEIVRRVRSLREQARRESPRHTNAMDFRRQYAWRSTHLLRHLIWVRRSRLSGKAPHEQVMQVPPHFVKACCDIFNAENGVMFIPHALESKQEIRYGQFECPGIVVWMPPAHGKTTIAGAWVVLRICKDPTTQGTWLHATSLEAEKALGVIKAAFRDDNEEGRRCLAMHPEVELSKDDDNKGSMRMVMTRRQKDPTLRAAGITNRALGADNDFQVRDDIVPQDDAYEETTRKRRGEILANTWDTRLRGKHTFTLNIGYPWHHQDALCRMVERARADAKSGRVGMAVSVQRITEHDGGRKIKPLWPDQYPASRLRRFRADMDRRLWNSNYLMDPTPDTDRIIRSLRFYDPADEEHKRFMGYAEGYLSLDPAGTNRADSDDAGILFAGFAQLRVTRKGESGEEYQDAEHQIRIVEAHGVKANQTELVNFGGEICMRRDVDWVLAEMVSGYQALGEMWRNKFGVDVIECPPGGKSKSVRLKRVSNMIDNSVRGSQAVVLFPGKRDEHGNLGPDPDWQWLYDQFLSFGSTDKDHLVDCTTQLCWHLADQVGVGRGAVSERIRRITQEEPRHVRYMRERIRSLRHRPSGDEEEAEFVGNRW